MNKTKQETLINLDKAEAEIENLFSFNNLNEKNIERLINIQNKLEVVREDIKNSPENSIFNYPPFNY